MLIDGRDRFHQAIIQQSECPIEALFGQIAEIALGTVSGTVGPQLMEIAESILGRDGYIT